MKVRIAFVHEEPNPYRVPFFNRLIRKNDIDFQVFYCYGGNLDRGGELELEKSREFSEILSGNALNIPFSMTKNYFNPLIWTKLSKGQFDCVLVGGYYHLTMLFAIIWARVHKVPYIIISESHFLNRRNRLKSFIKKILLTPIVKKTSAYLPLGKYAGEYLIHYGADPENIFYFPNTPNVEYFIKESDKYRREKNEIKKKLGIKNNYLVIYVGRLVKVKGLFTLLQGFKEVRKTHNNASLLFVGDGVLKNLLKEFVAKEEIEDVHFAGSVPNEELPRYYGISDIFVLPSLYEPWGVVVNEAMASALPIVLSDKVGSRGELLREGENGFTYPSKEYMKLAGCILKILSEPDELKEMGQLSRRIIQNFDYSFCEENLKKALLNIFKND